MQHYLSILDCCAEQYAYLLVQNCKRNSDFRTVPQNRNNVIWMEIVNNKTIIIIKSCSCSVATFDLGFVIERHFVDLFGQNIENYRASVQ